MSRYVARFIGSPQMDILAGAVERTDEGSFYRIGSVAFPIPDGVAPKVDYPVDLGVRPEHVHLDPAGIPLTVRVVQPLGAMTYVTIGWDEYTLTSRIQGMRHYQPGNTVPISLDPNGMLFFDRETGRRILPDGTVA